MIDDYGEEGSAIITKLLCNFKFFGQKKRKRKKMRSYKLWFYGFA